MSAAGHERVVVEVGERSGVTMAIAVHSTALGPALGGARMWRYESASDAVEDAKRLAASMTLKAAAAGLIGLALFVVLVGPLANPASVELALLSWLAGAAFILLVETSPI